MIILILINALVVFALLSLFPGNSGKEKMQKTLEIAVVTVIGFMIIGFAVAPMVGPFVALFLCPVWVFFCFRLLARLPVFPSLIAAFVILIVNLVLGAILGP